MDETIFGYICNVDEIRREYVRCGLWTNLPAKFMSDAGLKWDRTSPINTLLFIYD